MANTNKRRVIFVGVHYKGSLPALCSTTKSGKLIDRIIENIPKYECIKSNLFSTFILPKDHEYKRALAYAWKTKWDLSPTDIVVALGDTVQTYLDHVEVKHISIPHPAKPWSQDSKFTYVITALALIETA